MVPTQSNTSKAAQPTETSSGAPNGRTQRRASAIDLLQSGHSAREVAAALGVSVQAVRAWRRRYRQEGQAGLHDRARSGRPPKANQDYIDTLETILTEAPEDMDIDDAPGWTVPLLCRVMTERTGVWLCPRQMRVLLHRLGYRYQPAPSLFDALTPPLPDDPSELRVWLRTVEALRAKLPASKCTPVISWVKVKEGTSIK